MKTRLYNSTLHKKIPLAFIVCFLCSITQSFSQAGTLDSSFGVNGTITNTFGYDYLYPKPVAIQPDGKIIVAGNRDIYSSDSLVVARYQVKGDLDSSFGIDGKVSIYVGWNNGSIYYRVVDIVIQKDGKIIVGGCTTLAGPNYFLIERFLPDGNLDSSFGVNGKVSTLVHEWREVNLSAIALQSDGKILAGGSVDGFCLIRYLSNGIVDSSFGVNGRIQNEGDFRIINDLAVLSNEKIIVGITNSTIDTATSGYINTFEIDRLSPDGIFDSTFGNNGKVITEFDGDDWLSSIAISNNNEIVASGVSYPDGSASLAKYKENGSLDPSFGNNGQLHTAFNASYYNKVMTQKNGKVIVAGSLLFRVNSNGSTDSSYGLNGIAQNFNAASDASMQADEKVITVNAPYFTLQRFKGDPVSVNLQKNLTTFEGNSGTTPVIFKIVLNETSAKRVTVNYATVDGTAKAGQDYIAISGTLTFRPGETLKRVTVNVIGDNVAEKNEKFSLQLSNPKNAILGTLSNASCTIKNDDPSFQITSLDEDDATSSIELYPNPSKDVLNIEGLSSNGKTTISILDMQGRVLMKEAISNAKASVNVKALVAGSYLIKIVSGNKMTTLNFVKIQ
jgi:uncharacterized delta-60 repeat protein